MNSRFATALLIAVILSAYPSRLAFADSVAGTRTRTGSAPLGDAIARYAATEIQIHPPVTRRKQRRTTGPLLVPVAIGAAVGLGFGLWVGRGSEAPKTFAFAMTGAGAVIGLVVGTR